MFKSTSYLCLALCIFVLSRTSLQLPLVEKVISELPKDLSKIIASGNSALEEEGNDPPVYIMVPVVGDRARRGAEDGNVVSLENVSYEVPTFIKFNESAKGDIEVSLIPNPENHQLQAVPQAAPQSAQQASPNAAPQVPSGFGSAGNGVNMNNYCPPLNGNNKTQPFPPICLTLSIDNIFPPGKKVSVTNSSDIKGSGCVLRIKFSEAKESANRDDCKTTLCASDLLGIGGGIDQAMRQRLDIQKKKKFDDEEDEFSATTQLIDQKNLQELIFKILTSNKVPNSTMPTEEVVFFERATTEPTYSFLINPSILQSISGKHMTPVSRSLKTTRAQNSADFDSLLKTVEHITSTMPKEKLLSLLSSLINKATLNKEFSSNQ